MSSLPIFSLKYRLLMKVKLSMLIMSNDIK